MAVTIKDIANVCNVSYSTVSRVLNNKCVRQTEQTRRILDVAQALGYKPNTMAVNLVKQSSNMLGLMIPDIANPHYSEMTKCVEDAARLMGYRVFLCNTDWDVRNEVMYRDSLLESRVTGIVFMPVCDESHMIFKGADTPVVVLGSRTEEPNCHYVVMDNERAGFLATEHLVKRGCKNICYIGRKVENLTSADRKRGVERAARQFGIAPVRFVNSDSFAMKGGTSVAAQLLRLEAKLDGIIAFNDYIAIGAMQAVEDAGLTVGTDVAVIGFDDILFSSLPKINLTTITPDNNELGRRALEMVLKAGDMPGVQQTAVLEPHLVERAT